MSATNSAMSAITSSLEATALNRAARASLRRLRCLPAEEQTLTTRAPCGDVAARARSSGRSASVTRRVPATLMPMVTCASSAPKTLPL